MLYSSESMPVRFCAQLSAISFLVLMVTGCNNNLQHPRQQLTFSQDTFDLGFVTAGTKKSFSIGFKNNSDSSVEITGFSTSCKCVLIDSEPFTVNANTTRMIKGTVEADSSEKGEIFRSIALRTAEKIKPIKIAVLKFKPVSL